MADATVTAEAAQRTLVRGRLAEAGAVLSGLLYWLAFAGFDIWPLTFFAWVPLYLSLFGQTTKRATWLGFLSGLTMNLGGFYWLLNMLRTFSGFPTALCLVFVVIICAYQGGRLAFMGWVHGRAQTKGWPVPLAFAGAFVVSEIGLYPLLFPWFYATTVHKVPILSQLADIGGPILVGLVLVAVNLAVAEPLRARLASTRELALDKRVIGASVLALLFALVYGAARISMMTSKIAAAPKVHVGYVQGNMGLMQKREDPGEGLRRHRRLTAELKSKGAELVVWSESSVTFAVPESLGTKSSFYKDKFAASLAVPTIFGGVLYRVDPDRERWFNSALATNAAGDITGRYDKQFLLAFGEYLPLGDTFPIMYKWSPHSGRFSPGTSLDPVEIDIKGEKHKVTVLICYEDILPRFTNAAVGHANPELLVNITNDAWFGDTTEPWEHLALAKLRAVEHRRYLVRSTNTGVSAIIDPTGAIVEGTLSSTFKAEARDAEIRWLSGGTLYESVGDAPWYLATLAMGVACFRRRRR